MKTTDRKQEAIDNIANVLCPTSQAAYSGLQYQKDRNAAMVTAKSLHDRIAPLIRGEFPDAAMKEMLIDSPLLSKEALFWKIKCICEGQQPREGDNILEQEEPKGTCPKCGGSGRDMLEKCPTCDGTGLKVGNLLPLTVDQHVCPDCDGTGECQHKGNIGWLDAEHKVGPPVCFDCQGLAERRSGKERREGIELLQPRMAYPGEEINVNMFTYDFMDKTGKHLSYELPDRRILSDRRKAGSG